MMTAEEIIKEIQDRREQLKMYILIDLEKAPYSSRSNIPFYRVGYWELSLLMDRIETANAMGETDAAIR